MSWQLIVAALVASLLAVAAATAAATWLQLPGWIIRIGEFTILLVLFVFFQSII